MEAYSYKYPRAAITCDIIVSLEGSSIILIKRGVEPFKDMWAFPGGHFDPETDVSLRACAFRELCEETNILEATDNTITEADIEDTGLVMDAMDRDPRGRVITHVYFVDCSEARGLFLDINKLKGLDDAKEIGLFPIDELPLLAFDHKAILDELIDRAARGAL